jgi:eukaryotic-like serine/threonine-protein kinase
VIHEKPPGPVAPAPTVATTVASRDSDAYADTVTPVSVGRRELSPPSALPEGEERYLRGEVIGEGGMGEVHLCKDARIGRDVAMKVVHRDRGARSDLRSRFLREARVQGQLEHPAIVPVYDLDVLPDGALYFTMKRILGVTLADVVALLAAKDDAAQREYSRRRLLTAFSSVCLAVDFAHTRGVVHRDLKPENVMLGAYGEVYVLDWGVAKIDGDADDAIEDSQPDAMDAAKTLAGALVGTPGYMAPEQLEGKTVDRRADIYALGVVLFELLTYETLHPRAPTSVTLASTLAGAEARLTSSTQASDVPPELEAICLRATARMPDQRFSTARELHDAVERFLDGDRDLERRRELSVEHARKGNVAAERAIFGAEAESNEERRLALKEIGRALVLDPTNAHALHAMVQLVATPPRELPPDARRDLDEARAQKLRDFTGAEVAAYLSWFLFLPLFGILGFTDPMPEIVTSVCMLIAAGLTWMKRRDVGRLIYPFGALISCGIAIAWSSRVFGPLILTPVAAIVSVLGFSLNQEKKYRVIAGIVATSTVAVPLLLEMTGAISPSYRFEAGRMIIEPHAVFFSNPTAVLLLALGVNVGLLALTIAFIGWIRDRLAHYEELAVLQAWHFRQLAPMTH